MIRGYVDKQLQAKVPLAVLAASGQETILEVVVDSGFNGELCVSMHQINKMALTFSHFEEYELGNGKVVKQDIFRGKIIFDGKQQPVDVLVSKSRDTLIGAALMTDKKLEIDYANENVRIRNSRKRMPKT